VTTLSVLNTAVHDACKTGIQSKPVTMRNDFYTAKTEGFGVIISNTFYSSAGSILV